MTTKIKKWGNSYAVRIPKEILEEAHLSEDESVSFSVKDRSITISRKKSGKAKDIIDLYLKPFSGNPGENLSENHDDLIYG